MPQPKPLSTVQRTQLLKTLQDRFEQNRERHVGIKWAHVEARLSAATDQLPVLAAMEQTGGEPDVVAYDKKTKQYTFFDCAEQSPTGRRSLCYDEAALKARKANKPKGSAVAMAKALGIAILSEAEYNFLQTLGDYDTKTSSWVDTPEDIRSLGGALACTRRYGRVFVNPNGADSYYAARGFRGSLRV